MNKTEILTKLESIQAKAAFILGLVTKDSTVGIKAIEIMDIAGTMAIKIGKMPVGKPRP